MPSATLLPQLGAPEAGPWQRDGEFWPGAASATQEPEHERQHHRDDEAGDDREIEAAALGLDANVAGKAPEAQSCDPRPYHADEDERRADDDERALHL